MNGKYKIEEIFFYTLRKLWIITIIALASSILIGLPKVFEKQNIIDNNNLYVSSVIGFQNHATYMSTITNAETFQDYSDIWFRNPFLSKFISMLSDKYDMSRIYSKWNTITDYEKMNWIREVLIVNPMKNTPNYEINLTLSPSIINYKYTKENITIIFDDFVKYATESTKILSEKSVSTVLSYSFITAKSSKNSKIYIVKYFIIGGVLGFIIAVFILLLLFLFGKKVVSKTYYIQKYLTDYIDNKNNATYKTFCYVTNKSVKNKANISVVYSTLKLNRQIGELYNLFIKNNYKICFLNITGTDLDLGNGLFVLNGETCDYADNRENHDLVPGRLYNSIDEISKKYDYVLIYCNDLNVDPISLEIISNSACILMYEKMYSSSRHQIDSNIENIKTENSNVHICMIWNK